MMSSTLNADSQTASTRWTPVSQRSSRHAARLGLPGDRRQLLLALDRRLAAMAAALDERSAALAASAVVVQLQALVVRDPVGQRPRDLEPQQRHPLEQVEKSVPPILSARTEVAAVTVALRG